MEMNGLMGGIYRAAEWIMRLAALNLLWIGFTIAGLVVGGLFPATQASFALTRQWIRGESDLPLFKTFLSYFKKDYWKVQGIGFTLTIVGFVLIVDILFVYNHTNPYITMLSLPLLLLCLLYALTCFYAFSVFVHYELSIGQLLKHAVLHAVVRPFLSITMLLSLAALSFLMLQFPGVLPFFGVSIPIFLLMWFSHFGFIRNEEKQKSEAA
ncbi:YesL family protein [Bacillus sp. JCM 19041]|uniref:YesL family protein n=1 Tax=Bacillus sp. JCM 19041 TaxID=1460637 RepID=UPI0006CFF941